MKENILIRYLSEAAPVVGESTDITLKDFFTTIGDIPSIITAVILLIIGIVLSKLILFIMNKGMEKSHIDKTVTRFSYSLVKIILYIIVATIVLAILGIPMSSIIAVIGTAGVTVGLALKDSLSNIAGGFTILITKPFAIGDYILTEGAEGTVELIKNIDPYAVIVATGRFSSFTMKKQSL